MRGGRRIGKREEKGGLEREGRIEEEGEQLCILYGINMIFTSAGYILFV